MVEQQTWKAAPGARHGDHRDIIFTYDPVLQAHVACHVTTDGINESRKRICLIDDHVDCAELIAQLKEWCTPIEITRTGEVSQCLRTEYHLHDVPAVRSLLQQYNSYCYEEFDDIINEQLRAADAANYHAYGFVELASGQVVLAKLVRPYIKLTGRVFSTQAIQGED